VALTGIEIRGLVKRYPHTTDLLRLLRHPWRREEILALDGVDLVLRPGRIYGLVGPNGAGKTTLLKILAGLVLPTEGSLLFDGEDAFADPARVRETIGFVVADERSFFWRLTVRENLRFFATLQKLPRAEREARITSGLARAGLTEHGDRSVRSLSTGLRQRLSIARGLLVDPPVLLLDEPTRSLDPGAARQVRELLRDLVGEDPSRTLVYATHNLPEVEDLCTDVVVLRRGKVVAQQPLRGGPDGPGVLYRVRTAEAVPASVFEGLPRVECVRVEGAEVSLRLGGLDALDLVVDRLRGRGIRVLELQPAKVTAETYFAGEDGEGRA
jgi:ABC-2 type transport system ATP-binding protein